MIWQSLQVLLQFQTCFLKRISEQTNCFVLSNFISSNTDFNNQRLVTYLLIFQVFVTFEGRIGSAKIRRFEELHITLGSRGSSTGKSSRRLGLGCRAFISVFRIAQINGSFLISDLLLYILIGFESVSFKSRFTSWWHISKVIIVIKAHMHRNKNVCMKVEVVCIRIF